MSKKIMIMAGGTGGHVFPGLAVAEELRQQGHEVFWLGTKVGIENRLVPAANIPLHYINVVGLRGKGMLHLAKAPFKILQALFQAMRVVKQEQPDCVLGMGGFVAGPGAIAAKLKGIPLVIHEQNAVPGTTNRLLAKRANKVLQAFPNSFEAAIGAQTIGNPVRASLPATQFKQQEKLNVLVIGGSLGAQAINQVMPAVLEQLKDKIELWHQAGPSQYESCKAAYGHAGVRLEAFIDDMAAAYQWADVVICRAGAMTVSEIAAVGLPAIFVPLPHAIDDHQTANAKTLADKGAAILLPQTEMSAEKIIDYLNAFSEQKDMRQQMAEKAALLGVRDAAKKAAQVCLELTE